VCFSVEADLVAGFGLLPVAVLSLREVRHPRELPFAILPLLFALHQLTESLVWAGLSGDVSPQTQHVATMVYVLFALPVLPTLVPLAVLMLEPQGARLRVVPFLVVGAVVTAYLGFAVIAHGVSVVQHPHALEYQVQLTQGTVWVLLYVVSVIGAPLISGYPSIVLFGVLNLVGLTVAAVLYQEAFTSLWCVYAALVSLLVLVHMVRRRRLPDPHRLQGQSMLATC
jgi:hypothetical protein